MYLCEAPPTITMKLETQTAFWNLQPCQVCVSGQKYNKATSLKAGLDQWTTARMERGRAVRWPVPQPFSCPSPSLHTCFDFRNFVSFEPNPPAPVVSVELQQRRGLSASLVGGGKESKERSPPRLLDTTSRRVAFASHKDLSSIESCIHPYFSRDRWRARRHGCARLEASR